MYENVFARAGSSPVAMKKKGAIPVTALVLTRVLDPETAQEIVGGVTPKGRGPLILLILYRVFIRAVPAAALREPVTGWS